MSEWGTVVADACAISGSHKDVVGLPTDQVTQGAVWAGAATGEVLSAADGFQGIAHCVGTRWPGYLRSGSATHPLTGYIRGRTWLWRGKQNKPG